MTMDFINGTHNQLFVFICSASVISAVILIVCIIRDAIYLIKNKRRITDETP